MKASKTKKTAPKKTAPKKAAPKRVEAPAPTAARTVPCRLCKARVEFTQGLDEMAEHWELAHPEALEKMRARE